MLMHFSKVSKTTRKHGRVHSRRTTAQHGRGQRASYFAEPAAKGEARDVEEVQVQAHENRQEREDQTERKSGAMSQLYSHKVTKILVAEIFCQVSSIGLLYISYVRAIS